MLERDAKLLEWATGDDTGVSSEALLRYMMGFKTNRWAMTAPSDKWDRGRCIRLLNIVPEWWDRIDELEPYWGEQVDLIKKERPSLA